MLGLPQWLFLINKLKKLASKIYLPKKVPSNLFAQAGSYMFILNSIDELKQENK